MIQCLMTDGCHSISYIAVTSICVRHRKWLERQPQNSSSAWSLIQTSGKDAGCPLGWHRFETSCFLIADVAMNWTESVTYCQKWDARLAEVENELKATFLLEIAVCRPGKAARDMFFRVLSAEEPSIRILTYAPGAVDTDMMRDMEANVSSASLRKALNGLREDGKLLTPEESVADLIQVLEDNTFDNAEYVNNYIKKS
ncbi:uncharacterized protein LOC117343119 isoform X2 [Pecten maximus]|uniref:uncharacterized protein LOC117343119 isoform X2 n=1 Tax=Pecten maximus TaxID=6579 RepID=UPI001458070B|nr:uncharacterized protein LOC117343119 isoform X2 [Pecten maximus]